jgi:FtsP/CotA-like multicopper oxidase with cupredoxin domain
MYTKLYQPSILDFTKLNIYDDVKIIIQNSIHKFSQDAKYSGFDKIKQPIFGSKVYINNTLHSTADYGFPFIRFIKGSTPKITYVNETLFTFSIHYHGLNTIGSIDGSCVASAFGHSTKLGRTATFQFPKITNNQFMSWYHSHNMFTSIELIYSGAFGLFEIIDEPTKWLLEQFNYGDNHIAFSSLDIDLTSDGIQTNVNLTTDQNRSCFSVINGTCAINWYSNDKSVGFVNMLYYKTTKKLVKIDIVNTTLNWRVYYIGVCDINYNIKNFNLVQTDNGLMNPKKLTMTSIPVASRIGIIIDLNDFIYKEAYLFYYNFDLTEILNTNQISNLTLISNNINVEIPDFNIKNSNLTPYPNPLNLTNDIQQKNQSKLNYPNYPKIPYITPTIIDGDIEIPYRYTIKPFLQIIYENINPITEQSREDCLAIQKDYRIKELKPLCLAMGLNPITEQSREDCLAEILTNIKKTIFGRNYNIFKYSIDNPNFEYYHNYISLLNNKYFYNLPNINPNDNIPFRNFLLFSEDNSNSIEKNVNGITEYVNEANRLLVDLWNSNELDLTEAMVEYEKNPNNYRPNNLPTSRFRIVKTNDDFSNTAMISNDTLIIQIFDHDINYGQKLNLSPLIDIKITFPPNDNLNIQEWINLINDTFINTKIYKCIINNNGYKNLGDILKCNWSFFPYKLNDQIIIKSAIITTKNSSNYNIRLLSRWPLLQLFGKSMTGDKLNGNTNAQYIKCNEYDIYGIHDADIQEIFPFYATFDGNKQLPIACMKRNCELIILNNNTYNGIYDGYWNDNLNSFSVNLKSTELWLYNNGDIADAHSLHFHNTSGYSLPYEDYNSSEITTKNKPYKVFTYGRDIYQIGPQQTIGFYISWPFYSSDQQTSTPDIKGCGGMIHCHFLKHNDSNSMSIQYYIEP